MGHRHRYFSAFAAAWALVWVLTACAGGTKEDPLDADWAALQEEKAALDSKRHELADLMASATAAEAAESQAGEEGVEAVDDGAVDIDALKAEIAASAEEFNTKLVDFLNADPMIEGEPISERQRAAIRLKSSEDMVLAKEWINEGGDYKRAIDIYNQALILDPDNAELGAAKAAAEAARYMSEERFAAAKKGMTEAEIKSILGTPLHYNVRTYEDKGVTAWFYPTSEDGGAAAVWFRPDDDGTPQVYQVKYEAVSGKEEA